MGDDCAICLEPLATPGRDCQRLGCGHALHKHCVVQMRRLGASSLCPLCRRQSDDLATVESMFSAAVELYVQKNYVASFRKHSELLDVDPDHAPARFILGWMQKKGLGVPVDLQRARQCYEQAHAAGHAPATNKLGLMHEQGRGVPVDLQRARQYYEQAHAAGHAGATFNLGVMHRQGLGLPAIGLDFPSVRARARSAFLKIRGNVFGGLSGVG